MRSMEKRECQANLLLGTCSDITSNRLDFRRSHLKYSILPTFANRPLVRIQRLNLYRIQSSTDAKSIQPSWTPIVCCSLIGLFCRNRWQRLGLSQYSKGLFPSSALWIEKNLGPPVVPFYILLPFLAGGFPYQNRLQKKESGALILTSLLRT